jgi:Cu+-exporting ATPase
MKQANCNCHVEPVRSATDAAGRPTTTVQLFITGMGCPNCALRVQNALAGVPGVTAARVTLVPPFATVQLLPDQVTYAQLSAAVRHAAAASRHDYRAYDMDPTPYVRN